METEPRQIQPASFADLLLLNGDPFTAIRILHAPARIIADMTRGPFARRQPPLALPGSPGRQPPSNSPPPRPFRQQRPSQYAARPALPGRTAPGPGRAT